MPQVMVTIKLVAKNKVRLDLKRVVWCSAGGAGLCIDFCQAFGLWARGLKPCSTSPPNNPGVPPRTVPDEYHPAYILTARSMPASDPSLLAGIDRAAWLRFFIALGGLAL